MALLIAFPPATGPRILAIATALFIVTLVFWCWLFVKALKISPKRAAQAFFVVLFAGIACQLAMSVVIETAVHPYLIETVVQVSMPMAPNVLPKTIQSTCPTCGSLAFGSARDLDPEFADDPHEMICKDHYHTFEAKKVSQETAPKDRAVVCKFLQPERWDIIMFDSPEQQGEYFLMRVVGMPGEKVTIVEGRVHINGQAIPVPEHLQGIEYTTDMEYVPPQSLWGHPDKPAQLGLDEYFVLGDFSQVSKDSRLYDRDLAGHSPFAVPASEVRGVLTHCYWPMSRWRCFR